MDAENVFKLIQKIERVTGGTIKLVHKGKDGDTAASTDFEEFSGLGFDSLGGIDDHNRGIDGGKDSISIFGKVSMAWGIEEVDDVVAVGELEDGGGDGDSALLLEFHPIAGGSSLVTTSGDAACELDCPAVKEELFGEGGLSCVGVRDNGKSAAPRDFASGQRISWARDRGHAVCFLLVPSDPQIGPRQRVNPAVRLRRIQRQFYGRSNVGIVRGLGRSRVVFSSCGGRIKSDRVGNEKKPLYDSVFRSAWF
jgi:hypothetical protein